MNKKLVQKKYDEKIKLIHRYNKVYYDENNSEISDADYDLIKKEIIEFEKKYNFLKKYNSPITQVGYKPSKIFKKVLPVLRCMGRKILYTGELGTASILKVITNYLASVHLAALGEAWTVAKKSKLNLIPHQPQLS